MNSQDRRWFTLQGSQVSGPFDQATLDQNFSTDRETLIWGRGQTDWAPYHKWIVWLKESEESERKQKLVAERLWKVNIMGQEMKPMNYDQMLDFLKTQSDFSQVQIWTEGYSEWKEIYQIHKIMDELGVSRRQHPRVPIAGSVVCEGASGSFEARALSISEGGLGMTDAPNLKIGEKFKVLLKSPNLFAPIHATAEIVFIGDDSYAGLKFIGLQTENKAAIIEYVKKFQELKSPSKS